MLYSQSYSQLFLSLIFQISFISYPIIFSLRPSRLLVLGTFCPRLTNWRGAINRFFHLTLMMCGFTITFHTILKAQYLHPIE